MRTSKTHVIWDLHRCPVPKLVQAQFCWNKLKTLIEEHNKKHNVAIFVTEKLKNRAPQESKIKIYTVEEYDINKYILKYINAYVDKNDDIILLSSISDTLIKNITHKIILITIDKCDITSYTNIKKIIKWHTFLDCKKILKSSTFDSEIVCCFPNVCHFFNTFNKCSRSICISKHVCTLCSSKSHGRYNCPFLKERDNIILDFYTSKTSLMRARLSIKETIICEEYNNKRCDTGGLLCIKLHKCMKCGTIDSGVRYCVDCRTELIKCEKGFHCMRGIHCIKYHNRDEMHIFLNNSGHGIVHSKINLCVDYEKGYCSHDICIYAHTLSEILCPICNLKGVHHYKECPYQMTELNNELFYEQIVNYVLT